MTALLITIHVIVSIALILIVLLQTGKGADMGAVFGGAGSQALFGNTGASTFLGKMTTVAAVIFMLTSLTLAYISKSGGDSVVSGVQPVATHTQPVTPPAQPAPMNEQKTTGQNNVTTTPATTESHAGSKNVPASAPDTSSASKSDGAPATSPAPPTPEQ